MLIGAVFFSFFFFWVSLFVFFRLAKHTADGQIWATCGVGVSGIGRKCESFHLGKKKKKVRAPLGIAFFSLFNAALAGSHSELCAETVTPRKIQWIFAISLCDGLGWLAAAGSIGFYFARLLGCLSCLPA